MIFLTVGSQMPFPRLVGAVDAWAQRNPGVEIVAQIGRHTSPRPVALTAFESVSPARFSELIRCCELMVAHAGMGSVLTALEHEKPMILMPRRAHLHETRNEHQGATLRWLESKPGIYAADDETALGKALDDWRKNGLAAPVSTDRRPESLQSLIETVRAFIA